MEKIILFFLRIQTAWGQGGVGGGSGGTVGGGSGGTVGGGSGGTVGGGSGITPLPNPIPGDILDIIARVMNFLVTTLAPPLVAILIVFGAFQMIFAGGNPEKISKGKMTIVYSVVGYLIILLASGVATLIKNVLSGN